MQRNVYLSKEAFLEQNRTLNTGLPWDEDVTVLGKEYRLGEKIIANRIACQAMEGCDGTADGRPDMLTKRRYERLARGGAGIIWFEATAVMEEGRANPRQLYITKENLDSFKAQVETIKETALKENGFEPLVIMQATHSGRYSKPQGSPAPIIAYNNPIFEKDNPIPQERIATDEHLDRIGAALVNGAALAEQAGFDGVDIKCCHRYINSELLSAFERNGRYGGSLENRTRLLRESVQGAMAVTGGKFIVTSRLNVYDGFPYPYGFGVADDGSTDFISDEAEWLIRELYSYGMRMIDITMGNPYFNPHVNRPFAIGAYEIEEHPLEGVSRMLKGTAKLKAAVPEMAFISSALSYLGVAAPNVTAAFINDGGFDFAGFGRTILAYPDFAKDILEKKTMDRSKCCICCSRCSEIMKLGGTPGCVVRDREIYGKIYNEVVKK